MYSQLSKILYRLMRSLMRFSDRFNRFVMYRVSRRDALNLRKRLTNARGKKIVNGTLKAEIKHYCHNTFSSSSYWPWIALYTEMRGEFIEGWIPDDIYRFEILPRVNPEKFRALAEAKSIDQKLFPGMTVKPFIVRLRGKYIDKTGNILNAKEVLNQLRNLDREIVIKPDDGRRGEGVLFLHSKDVNIDDLPSEADLMFQEAVRQHESLQEIHPYSINTFRVSTYLKERGEVQIKFINLRFGVGGNRVDNTSSGGMWVSVTLDGEVRGTVFDDYGIEVGNYHPDTGYRLSDLKLPFFNDIISLCKKAHKLYPYVSLVGWDVYVNEKGDPVILEWNASNPWFWEVEARFGPLWSEEEIGEILS